MRRRIVRQGRSWCSRIVLGTHGASAPVTVFLERTMVFAQAALAMDAEWHKKLKLQKRARGPRDVW